MRNIYDLKREIQDLKNVRDVIATLERISASYIPALRSHLEILEEYAEGNRRIFRKLGAKQTDVQEDDDISQSLVVVFSTDHGLVGGLNSRLIERVVEHVRDNPKDHVIVFGEKGKDLMRISGIHPAAIFSALTDKPSIDELREFFDQFFSTSDIAYRRVTVLAPRFVSVSSCRISRMGTWMSGRPPRTWTLRELGKGATSSGARRAASLIKSLGSALMGTSSVVKCKIAAAARDILACAARVRSGTAWG